MSIESIAQDLCMLRIYAHSVEEALETLPIGPGRNEAVLALATVDQKIAELTEDTDHDD